MKKAIEYKLTAVKNQDYFEQVQILTSEHAEKFCRNFYFDDILIYESFFMVLLNRNNKTIGWVKISQGGINGTVCDPRLIIKYTSNVLASGVILCHNHPSGAINPSHQDIELTNKIKAALTFIDVKIFDHIILTEEQYYSFADNGLI